MYDQMQKIDWLGDGSLQIENKDAGCLRNATSLVLERFQLPQKPMACPVSQTKIRQIISPSHSTFTGHTDGYPRTLGQCRQVEVEEEGKLVKV